MKAVALALLVRWRAGRGGASRRRSGFADMSPATQAMQRDDMANPACCG